MRRGAVRYLLAALFTTWSVFAPVKETKAAFPLVLVPGATLVFDSGAMAASYATALTLAGASLLYVKLKDEGGNTVLNVRVNPKAPQTVPSGWTAPATPGDPPVPPSTVAADVTPGVMPSDPGAWCRYNAGIGVCDASLADCQVNYAPLISGRHCVFVPTATPGEFTHYWNTDQTAISGKVAAMDTSTCGPGYTKAGGDCELTDAAAVPYPADNVGELKATTTGTPTLEARDADTSHGLPSNVEVGDGEIIVKGDGGTKKITIKTHEDGKVTITTVTGRGDGTSDREVLQFTPRDSGSASGGVALSGGVKDRVIGEGGSAEVGSDPGKGNAPARDPCGLPGTPACKIDETGTPSGSGTYTAATSALDTAAAARTAEIEKQGTTDKVTSFGWSFGWTLPTVSCANWDFTFRTWTKVVAWCDALGTVRTLFGWFLGLFSAIYIWRSASGAVGS